MRVWLVGCRCGAGRGRGEEGCNGKKREGKEDVEDDMKIREEN